MRLMFITSEFPNPTDATKAVFNEHLVMPLAETHEVTVVCPIPWVDELRAKKAGLWDPSAAQRARSAGASICYPRYWYPPKVLRSQYGRCYWWSVRNTLQRLSRDQRPDVLLSYWAHPDGEAAVRLGRRIGVPACVMVGGSDVLLLTRNRSRARLIANVLRAADLTITVNQHLREQVVELGVPVSKVGIWERGVDCKTFCPGDRHESRRRLGVEPGRLTMLWVGRFVPVKGLETLIDACLLLRERGTVYQVYLVGDGPLRPILESRVAAHQLQDRVHFVGRREPGQLADWYRAADVTVLPSWSEGLPNVLRESVACGTPFVASRVGGIAEIAGPSDRLIPAGDSAALADAVIEVFASPWQQSGSRPLPGWKESAERLVRLLEPLATRPAGQAPPASGIEFRTAAAAS